MDDFCPSRFAAAVIIIGSLYFRCLRLFFIVDRLYVSYRFMRGIEQQFLSLQKGFHELIPANLLRPFDERELELLIGGICKIDTTDWQANTRLKV